MTNPTPRPFLSLELTPDTRFLRAGNRWIADTFVTYAAARVTATAARYATTAIPVAGKNRDQLERVLGEKPTSTLLNCVPATVLNDEAAACWAEVTGTDLPCPVEFLGFRTSMSEKDRPDDLVLRYRLAGQAPTKTHKIWINHKLVTARSGNPGRVGSIRAEVASAIGEKVPHWKDLVPATVAALRTDRPMGTLVLVVDTSGGSVEVLCYEMITVFAYHDRAPVAGLHPDYWPKSEGSPVAQLYAKENSLVQADHRPAHEFYLTAAPALVANGVGTHEVNRLGHGFMYEHDARQRRELAEEAARRSKEFSAATGYETRLTGPTAPRPCLGLAPARDGRAAPRPLHHCLPPAAPTTQVATSHRTLAPAA